MENHLGYLESIRPLQKQNMRFMIPGPKDGNLDGSLILGVESVERAMHREINAPHLLIMLILPRTAPNNSAVSQR
jgi:hypothetical protein